MHGAKALFLLVLPHQYSWTIISPQKETEQLKTILRQSKNKQQ
jgi:hypothetical protein